jgi:hypothetical protein
MFTRPHLLASDWYRQRLRTKQFRDIALWRRHVANLEEFLANPGNQEQAKHLNLPARLDLATAELARVGDGDYLDALIGTLGADPLDASAAGGFLARFD